MDNKKLIKFIENIGFSKLPLPYGKLDYEHYYLIYNDIDYHIYFQQENKVFHSDLNYIELFMGRIDEIDFSNFEVFKIFMKINLPNIYRKNIIINLLNE